MKSFLRSVPTLVAVLAAAATLAWATIGGSHAQSVDPTPSRQTLEEASKDNCENVSAVVQRCAQNPAASTPAKKQDELTRSRAATKAAFDRRDKQGQTNAQKGTPPPSNSPVGDTQQLGGVTVTGKQEEPKKSVEATLQDALEQPTVSPNGTVSKYAPNGTRYDCIAKCVGPACCVEVRQLPNPARDSNSIGR